MTRTLAVAIVGLACWSSGVAAGGLAFVDAYGKERSGEHGASMVASPDLHFLYVSRSLAHDLEIFRIDPATGISQPAGAAAEEDYYFEALAISPDGKHLYAGISPAAPEPGDLYVYERDPVTGGLAEVAEYEIASGFGAIGISPDGAHVYVAAHDGSLGVFAREVATGALTPVETLVDGQGGVSGLGAASSATVTADGLHVYVTGGVPGSVASFARDAGTGVLTFLEAHIEGVGGTTGLAGAEHLVVSGDGAHVYVAGANDNAVVGFARDALTGLLTPAALAQDGVGDVPAGALRLASAVALAPDGTELYVGGIAGALSVFARDAGTGALSFLETQKRGATHDEIVAAPNGRDVYVTFHPSIGLFQRVDVACPAAPVPDCVDAPGASALQVRKGTTPARDRLKWTWRKGPPVAGFGADPLAATDFALCLYTGGVLQLQARAPAGGVCGGRRACWKPQKAGAYRYVDRQTTPDGIKRLMLRPGAAGVPRITATLGGDQLPLPPLPLGAPVAFQLVNDEGTCWGVTYVSPEVDTGALWKARSD